MRRYLAAYCVAALLPISATTAVAADMVVLESNVASLAPGSVVPASQTVSLASGAKLVMIAADGTTRAVSGPYSGPLGEAGSSGPGALERFIADPVSSNHVVGAIRAPSWEQTIRKE